MRIYEPHRSSLANMDANVLALLCYVAAFATVPLPILSRLMQLFPLIIYLMEKQSDLVRFHAMQAFLLQILSTVMQIVISVIFAFTGSVFSISGLSWISETAEVGRVISTIVVTVIIIVLSIRAAVSAFRWSEYDIPLIGWVTRKFYKPYT